MISSTMEFTSKSVEETHAFGERLGALLVGGDVLALVGQLGAGKTTLVQGLAKGLGVDPQQVKSPTFVLLREYAGRVPLVHIDGYRLDGGDSVVWLDLEWIFSRRKVTVIEWADRLTDCLPPEPLELQLAHKTTNQRSMTLVPHGARAEQLVEQLRVAA